MTKIEKEDLDIAQTEDLKSEQGKSQQTEVSPFIEAFRVLSHITTAIVLMLACGGIGYMIDQYFHVRGMNLIGFLAGGTLAFRHLLKTTSDSHSTGK